MAGAGVAPAAFMTAGSVPSPVDLHLHTSTSDGDLDGDQLLDACVRAGVRVVARTEHNTLRGSRDFAEAAGAAGIAVLPGCELSVRWRDSEWHLLAYGVDADDEQFTGRIDAVAAQERARYGQWLDRFAAAGLPVDPAPVRALLARTATPYFGRFLDAVVPLLAAHPAFARSAGSPYPQLVRDWFAPGRPFHVPEPVHPDVTEALDWIADAGGVAVLAHPGRAMPAAELAVALRPLVDRGLAGIEAWTSWHTPELCADLDAVARRLGLLATLGSDFHGPVKPWAPAPGALPAVPADPWGVVERLRAKGRCRT